MIRKPLLLSILVLAIGHVSTLAGQEDTLSNAHVRPNILFILTDDQAPWALGNAVKDGLFSDVPVASTPHMDRLAREGARFNNFFCTTPVCSPARVALLTGRYASEFGVTDFIPKVAHKLFDPKHHVALEPDQCTTFVEVLKASGYHTGLIGKLHVGDWTLPGHERFHPTNFGYDYFMGLTSGGTTPDNPELEKDGVVSRFTGLTSDILADHAITFIEEASTKPKPFLLSFHTRAPHGAWLPVAPEDWAPYERLDPALPTYPDLDVEKMKNDMREYLASTSGVDRNLGRILDRLDALNLTEKTMVILTSDHGYSMGHNGIRHKGNGIWATRTKPPGKTHHGTRVISKKYRPNMYDLSLKVPAIVRWPGVVKPGAVIDATASHLDWFPTLAAIARTDVPVELTLPGRSLVDVLRGQTPSNWDQDLFAEYHMINYVEADMWCYRTPKYKLVHDEYNEGRDEFFDLEDDPGESVNLINSPRPEIRAAIKDLDKKLRSRMKTLRDDAKGS